MSTDRLIESLVRNLEPVRSLPPTWRRVAQWLALSVLPVAIIVALMGVRSDLIEWLSGGLFLAQALAMIATVLAGSYAALAAGIPGRSRWPMAAPALPLAAWMGSLGWQYAEEWSRFGPLGAQFGIDVQCIPAIAIVGVVPMLAMITQIRKGAPYKRALAVFWGTLAASALANIGLRLFHPVDSALMVIAWQFGTVMALSGLAALARNRLVPSLAVSPASTG